MNTTKKESEMLLFGRKHCVYEYSLSMYYIYQFTCLSSLKETTLKSFGLSSDGGGDDDNDDKKLNC